MAKAACDENGFVRGFPYHDGFLDGILVEDGGKKLHLSLRAASGERNILTLQRVMTFHVENFREGNVVLNLRILSPDRVLNDKDIRHALMDRVFLDAANLPDDAVVFLLESSFGAEVLAVCHGVEVSQGRLSKLPV